MNEKCPICGGVGQKVVLVMHKYLKVPKTSIELCECTKSRMISNCPDYVLLKRIPNPDIYLPLDNIDKKLKFDPNDLENSPNYFIHTPLDNLDFYLNLKSIIMKFKFKEPYPSFYCCTSIDILKDFNLPQSDGSSPSITDINRYDLFVFSIDTIERNTALKSCVAQVVYNRLSLRKPTWICTPLLSIDQCEQVYSNELKEYMEMASYKTIKLNTTDNNIDTKKMQTDNKRSAEISPWESYI